LSKKDNHENERTYLDEFFNLCITRLMELGMPEGYGKSRVDKLDEGFLFLISLTSIIFMMVQAFSGGITFVLYSVPLLVVGVVMPFYYGYLRGALEDSAIMRVRGWIYLFMGAVGYIIGVIYFNIRGYSLAKAGSTVLLFLFGYLSGGLMLPKILSWIFEICNKEVSLPDVLIARYTMNTAYSLLLSLLWCAISYLNPETCRGSTNPAVCSLFTLLALPFILFLLGIIDELDSRKMLKNYGKPYRIVEHRKELLEKYGKLKVLSSLLDFIWIIFSSFFGIIASLLELERSLFFSMMILLVSILLLSALVSFLFRREIVFEH
jgi:hypothetical protein